MTEYRTSVENVRSELGTESDEVDLLSDEQIETVGLVPAHLEVDEQLANTNMSSNRLELIERYLAGHFILSSGIDRVRQLDRETLEDGTQYDYAGDRDDDGYQSTSLGQKAVMLDTSGTLQGVNTPAAALVTPDARGSARTSRR